MRGISKKMFISILTSVIVFVTMVATTFAWVGIFTYANTDSFKMNLKVHDLKTNYYLTISSSGKKGSFSDEVTTMEIERQAVNNRFPGVYQNQNDEVIHKIFNRSSLSNVSTMLKDNDLSDFYYLDTGTSYAATFHKTNDFWKFEFYLSVDTKEGITDETTGIKANVLFNNIEECLAGTKMYYRFLNHNPFSELPSGSVYDILKTIHSTQTFNIDSKNAVRFSLSLYDPININDEYTDELPIKTLVYQGGTHLPSYDGDNDVYDLGGILEKDYNTASKELLAIRPKYFEDSAYFDKLEETINNRDDLELIDSNKEVWNKDEHEQYLGCMNGIQTKMKVVVRLWFEGWDSDCIKAIEEKPISLNLSFTANKDI